MPRQPYNLLRSRQELESYFFDRLAVDFLTTGEGVVLLEREAGFFVEAGSEIGFEGVEEGDTSL